MGSGESTTRKVSFGVDDEDRVRILRGVKHLARALSTLQLSEDVLQRMRGVANIAPEHVASAPTSPQKDPDASPNPASSPRHQLNPQQPPQKFANKPTQQAKEEHRRFERHHNTEKEDSSREEMIKAMTHTHQEVEKTKQLSADELEMMVQQLQKKDSQLKALDAFYKDQLAQLEKMNLERYVQSKKQFNKAATKTEASVRSHNTEGVCPGLQTQILSCYKENQEQTLRCADLAKQYMRCIDAARKNLLVNHG